MTNFSMLEISESSSEVFSICMDMAEIMLDYLLNSVNTTYHSDINENRENYEFKSIQIAVSLFYLKFKNEEKTDFLRDKEWSIFYISGLLRDLNNSVLECAKALDSEEILKELNSEPYSIDLMPDINKMPFNMNANFFIDTANRLNYKKSNKNNFREVAKNFYDFPDRITFFPFEPHQNDIIEEDVMSFLKSLDKAQVFLYDSLKKVDVDFQYLTGGSIEELKETFDKSENKKVKNEQTIGNVPVNAKTFNNSYQDYINAFIQLHGAIKANKVKNIIYNSKHTHKFLNSSRLLKQVPTVNDFKSVVLSNLKLSFSKKATVVFATIELFNLWNNETNQSLKLADEDKLLMLFNRILRETN